MRMLWDRLFTKYGFPFLNNVVVIFKKLKQSRSEMSPNNTFSNEEIEKKNRW